MSVHSLRIDDLESAQMDVLSGDYEGALRTIALILEKYPDDLDALRLKGNTIELKVFAQMEPVSMAVRSMELAGARMCYEKILTKTPDDILTLKDLADHEKNFGRKSDALAQYQKLIDILEHEKALGRNVEEELADARQEYSELVSVE
jgi:tetratricopeptide (TPR) repeat protein